MVAVLMLPPAAGDTGDDGGTRTSGDGDDPYQSVSAVMGGFDSWVHPSDAVDLGDRAVMERDGAVYATDGTPEGTVRVAGDGLEDIELRHDAVIDGVAHFTARPDDVWQLWRTDGTAEGTELVVDADDLEFGDPDPDATPGTSGPSMPRVVAVGDRVAFVLSTADDHNDRRLFITDDSDAGASQALDERALPSLVGFDGFVVVGVNPPGLDRAVYRVDADGSTQQLWYDEEAGRDSPQDARDLVATSTHAFFYANHVPEGDLVLWTTDGTATGTGPVTSADDDPTPQSSMDVAEGRVYFPADNLDGSRERLWTSDGTSEGTHEVWDTEQLGDNIWWDSNSVHRATVGERFLMSSDELDDPVEEGWWAFDGATGEVEPLPVDGEMISPDEASSGPERAWLYGGGLWTTDGTSEGSFEVALGDYYVDTNVPNVWPVGQTALFLLREFGVVGGPFELSVADLEGPAWPDGAEVSAPEVGPTFATVAWDDAAAAGDVEVTGYRVQVDGEIVGQVDPTTTELLVQNLEPETDYTVEVDAVGGFARVTSGPSLDVTTQPDGDVDTVPLLASAGPGEVALDWPAATDEGFESYTVYRAEDDGDLEPLADGVTESEHVDRGPDAETTYRYEVTKVVDGVEQPHTDEAEATVPAVTIDGLGWAAPELASTVVPLDAVLTITAEGDPHRSAEVTLAYTGTDGQGHAAVLTLDEASPGTYRGEFGLSEGTAAVTGIDVQLCDDAGACAADDLDPDIVVGASADIGLGLDEPEPSLDGGQVALSSDSTGSGRVTEIGADGLASLHDLVPAGDYRLRVDDGDGNPVLSTPGITLEAGAVNDVTADPGDLALRVPVPVTVEDGDGSPRADARVTLTHPGGVEQARTDGSGQTPAFDGLALGDEVEILVDDLDSMCHPGWATETHVVEDLGVTVTVTDAPTATLSGTVRDGENEPIGASVHVQQQVGGQAHYFSARTDGEAGGTYSMSVCAADASVNASAFRISGGATQTASLEPGDNIVDLVVSREDTVALSFQTLVDPVDQPVGRLGSLRDVLRTVDGTPYTGNRHRAARGTTVELCADGSARGYSHECQTVETPESGRMGSPTLTLAAAAQVRAEVLEPTGSERINDGRVHLERIADDGTRTRVPLAPTAAATNWPLVTPFAVDHPIAEEGTYELYVTHRRGRTPVVRFEATQGEIVDLGRLQLQAPQKFTASTSLLTSPGRIPPGGTARQDATLFNSGHDVAEDAVVRVILAGDMSLVAGSVSVDGEPVDAGDLVEVDGGWEVSIGDVLPGDQGLLRYWVSADDAAGGQRLTNRYAVDYHVEGEPRSEELGSSLAYVTGIEVNTVDVTSRREILVAGNADVGADIEIYDGSVLIGQAQANGIGTWEATVELVDRGDRIYHELRAEVVDDSSGGGVARTAVRFDSTHPMPTIGRLDGREFDALAGGERFGFRFLLPRYFELEVEFDQPDRIEDADVHVGALTRQLSRDGDAFGTRFTVNLPRADALGRIAVDYDVDPLPLDLEAFVASLTADDGAPDEEMVRNRIPREWRDIEVDALHEWDSGEPVDDASPSEPDELTGDELHASGEVIDIDEDDPSFDGVARFEASSQTGEVAPEVIVGIEWLDDYQPTQQALDRQAATGVPAHELDLAWRLHDDGFDASVEMIVPAGVLPEDPELAAAAAEELAGQAVLAGHQGDGGAVAVEPQAQLTATGRAARVAYRTADRGSTASDLYGALTGAGVYEDIGDIHDQITAECGDISTQLEYRERVDDLANRAAATQGTQVVGMVAVGAAAAMTGGVGGAVILGAGALLDVGLDSDVQRRIDELRDEISADGDCDREADESDFPDQMDKWSPPGTQIADPQWSPVFIFDPAGYVFEAVESNRVADATVTVFEGDPSDADADPETWTSWDAEWFGQINPQVTGVDGRYAWDVPEGWWRTVAQKDGYTSVTSEVLRVLPEHFDVHLGIVSQAPPTVDAAVAWTDDDAVEVTFDHWMRVPRTLDGISVADDSGDEVAGSLEPVNPEPHSVGRMDEASQALVAPDGEALAETFTFVPDGDWSDGDQLEVTVDGAVEAYNRRMLGDDHSAELTVKARPAATELTVSVDDAGAPLPDVDVRVGDRELVGETDEAGTVTWSTATHDPVPHGEAQLVVARLGYEPEALTIDIAEAETTEVAVGLAAFSPPEPSVLDPADDPNPIDDPPDDDGPTPGDPPDDEPPADEPPADDHDDHPSADEVFSDVAGSTHLEAIGWTFEQGITVGFDDGTFRPGVPLTRGQMASFLDRALDLPDAGSGGFSDTAATTHEAAIDRLVGAGITVGFDDGTFGPQQTATRGQMASFLHRALA